MSETSNVIQERYCGKPTWHGPHPSDDAEDHGLTSYTCPGYSGGTPVHAPAEPESEQVFAAYDRGYVLGRRHMAELVSAALTTSASDTEAVAAIIALLGSEAR